MFNVDFQDIELILYDYHIDSNVKQISELQRYYYERNNPEYNTAKDICKYRGFKPGIVSFHVDNLVKYGYLVREDVEGDRRKYRLICTEKTKNVIEKGKKLQEKFAFAITKGLSDEDIKQFQSCLNIFEKNIEQIKKNGLEENE